MNPIRARRRSTCGYCCVLRRVSIAGAAVFGTWVLINITLFDGLSAINGKSGSESGVFLIGGNGRFEEVSKTQYAQMLTFELVSILCFLVGFVCAGIRNLSRKCIED